MPLETLDIEAKRKLEQFFASANKVFQEVEDLNGGLKDTAKAIAEELNVKPAEVMKAAKINYKNSLSDEEDKMETVRTLLEATR
jgi:hypothetical protein